MNKKFYWVLLIGAVLLAVGGSTMASGWSRGWAHDGELAREGKSDLMGLDAATLHQRWSEHFSFCDLAQEEGFEDWKAMMEQRRTEMLSARQAAFEARWQEMVDSGRINAEHLAEIQDQMAAGEPMEFSRFGGRAYRHGLMRLE